MLLFTYTYFYMSENGMRHFISFIGFLICLLLFFIGYKAGDLGWWWLAIFVIGTYIIIYKLLEV